MKITRITRRNKCWIFIIATVCLLMASAVFRIGGLSEAYIDIEDDNDGSSAQRKSQDLSACKSGDYHYNNLTYYTFLHGSGSAEMNSGLFGKAIKHQHQTGFMKPDNEECVKRFPTAAIIGVDKCGTREMLEFLHLHPLVEVYFDKSFEMDYFGADFSKGKEWLLSKMPCSYSNQMTIFKHSTYFHKDKIPKRIFEFNPDMKLILLVREPVSRTISRYMFEIITGLLEPGTALENVICQKGNIKDIQEENNNIIWHSTYDVALKAWLKYFNLSQILIIESDELKHTPAEVLTKAEKFLGLPHYIKPDTFIWNKEKGYHCLKSELTEFGMVCYGSERGKTLIDVNSKTKALLEEYFIPKNRNFFEMIGRKFDGWKS